MSFESLVWDITDGAVMGGGAVAQPPILKSMNRSPSFSLPFRRMDDHGEIGMQLANFDPTVVGRMRDDDFESRSGSDNLDGASGDDQDGGDDNPRQKKKKKYHRHTPNQIQELEGFFKECPHPDEKQRMELSRRLGLESKQIKFWFQNRRTQMKTQLERHENSILRQENEKLQAENNFLKQTISSPICNTCGGPAVAGEVSYEQHQLRIENARLRDELGRICSLTNKFLGRPICSSGSPSSLQGMNSNLELAVGRNGYPGPGAPTLPMGLNFGDGAMMPLLKPEIQYRSAADLAIGAMDELIKISQMESPLWIKNLDGGKETLNHEEYMRLFSSSIGKPAGFVTEASRDTGVIMISSLALVEMIMNADQWAEMFPCMIARAETIEVLSNGIGGTRHNSLQVMQAEFQVLSPFVPVRQSRFIRYCKQHAEGLWAVVDISIDGAQDFGSSHLYPSCRRLPSGCVIQDIGNGFSKVTWVEHTDYDESSIGHLFKPFVRSGFGFGAQKWLAALTRQCEFFTLLMSSTMSGEDNTGLTPSGKKSILKLAQRMTSNFCAGICASTTRKWDKLSLGNTGDDVTVLTCKNLNEHGMPPGIMVSASTSVLMPVSRHELFEFLQNEKTRPQWDILSDGGGPILEMVRIPKGRGQENRVSLLRGNAIDANVVVQETWNDAAGSMVVFAPVDPSEMEAVMGGGDPVYVGILPSGFAIFPCVSGTGETADLVKPEMEGSNGRCILTVGFQMLASSVPTAKLTMESIETVKNLLSCTLHKIRTALNIAEGAAGAAR